MQGQQLVAEATAGTCIGFMYGCLTCLSDVREQLSSSKQIKGDKEGA